MTTPAPIAVPLDTPDIARACAWAAALAPVVSTMKVGLELFCAEGPAAVEKVQAAGAAELFLDLKLHDIPTTVGGAARSLRPLAPAYLTVHAAAGQAAVAAAAQALPETRITAVTVLTSLDEAALVQLGLAGPAVEAACRLAVLAVEAGARAVVCSPQEVAAVRASVGADVALITPGVRPAGASRDDQARSATPAEALAAGSDLLVIGRPITAAADPVAAAEAIAATL